jgi:peptide/nickel transport system substrate-binding protein
MFTCAGELHKHRSNFSEEIMKRIFASLVVLSFLIVIFALVMPGALADNTGNAASPNTLPHPLLSQYTIRKAIAHCTDKDALIAAAYPELTPAERAELVTDSFFLKDHWAYTQPSTTYPYDPALGISLLETDGWLLQPGLAYRSMGNQELALTISSTDSEMRINYLKIFQEQMTTCGIRLIVHHQPFWALFSSEGILQRNFELSAYAWMNAPDDEIAMAQLYGCDAIPYPENGWEGSNFPGWCNQAATDALIAADDPDLSQAERIAYYAIAQDAFAADLPVLPLFQRIDALPNESIEHIDFNLDALFLLTNPRTHPILGAQDLRRAVAYCTDKDALLAAAYPDLSFDERQALITDSFFPKDHWAYTPPSPDDQIEFDPVAGISLLESLGWVLSPGSDFRQRDGKELALSFKSTDAEVRVAYSAVFQQQMADCGIRVELDLMPAGQFFHPEAQLSRRDFELGAYAWVMDEYYGDGMDSLYGCSHIPLPHNGWAAGNNFSGWCNQAASEALALASDPTLPQQERIDQFAIAQEAFYQELPVLPLFVRPGTSAWEHIDMNLDTFVQVFDVPVGEASNLTFTTFGSRGDLHIPAGAVSEPIELLLKPLDTATNPVPEGSLPAFGCSLTAAIDGADQEDFTFLMPVRGTLNYTDSSLPDNFDETSLRLYLWGDDTWQDAYLSCPEADRFFALDTDLNRLAVNICHLSEFQALGDVQYSVYLPITRQSVP